MRITPLIAASIFTVGLSVAAASSIQAAPLVPLNGIEANQSLATPVDYRRYCFRWRHICADRWGWGGWPFRRCLARHGC
jgi:hypothetical protein